MFMNLGRRVINIPPPLVLEQDKYFSVSKTNHDDCLKFINVFDIPYVRSRSEMLDM